MVVFIGMNQVCLHRIGFTVNMVFARHMKVELLEFELDIVDDDGAPRLGVYLNGVAVVKNFCAAGVVGKGDGLQLGIDKAAQVDR